QRSTGRECRRNRKRRTASCPLCHPLDSSLNRDSAALQLQLPCRRLKSAASHVRGSILPSSEAFSASTLDSMYASASAQVALMREVRDMGASTGLGCCLAFNSFMLFALGQLGGEAIVDRFVNAVIDVFRLWKRNIVFGPVEVGFAAALRLIVPIFIV